jgi:hypothetical protein
VVPTISGSKPHRALLLASVVLANDASTLARSNLVFKINGAGATPYAVTIDPGSSDTVEVHQIVTLSAADTVDLQAFNASAAGLSVLNTELSVIDLGPKP